MAKKSSSETPDRVTEELTASDVLQRRMGLGKLIADRLAEKLSSDDQKAFVASHVDQDFDAYSSFVAQLQYGTGEATTANTAGTGTGESSEVSASKSEAEVIREYLTANPEAENKDVIAALDSNGVKVSSSQVSAAKRQLSEG